MQRDDTLLLIVDLQARLVPALEGGDACVATASRLIRGARALGVPVLATEHMPERIGATVPALRDLLAPEEIVAKTSFAAPGAPKFRTALTKHRRGSVAVCGAEAHVCVMQTALALREIGITPLIVEDAVASRFGTDRRTALARMSQAGLVPVTAEMLLFEWLGRGDDPACRAVLEIVKERGA